MKRRALVWAWLLCLVGLASGQLQAAPQVSWSDQVRAASQQERRGSVSLDLREIWEGTRVGQVTLANDTFFDPEQVWNWPSARFEQIRSREAYFLRANERLVSRVTLFSEAIGTDLNLSALLPRLDAMHVSYRYDNGPWTTLSAGDTLAMDRWLVPDRYPAFDIPLLKGQLDIVVQLVHRGNAFAPYLLQNDRAYMASLTSSTWTVGVMTGIQWVMALIGVLLAINFRRSAFLAVTLMSLLTVSVILFGSGVGGQYWLTSSSSFNDVVKFFSATLWCLALPVVAAMIFGLRQSSITLCNVAVFWLMGGAVGAWFWSDYALRDTTALGLPLLLVATFLLTTIMVMWSGWRNLMLQPVLIMALVAYASALLMPFIGFTGLLSNSAYSLGIAGLMLLSCFFVINGLYARHRMGRQVLARANISPLRDVLTGLLSREGTQSYIYNKVRERLLNDNTCAVFIYISVMDAEQAKLELGEQGFEMGMVQIAASLSTSVTGADGLGRVSQHAFGVTVLMPPDPALATRFAQKILSRLMALASHGAPLAGSARLILSWLPLHGFRLDSIERHSLRSLDELSDTKRIGWVGGVQSHLEAAQMLRDARQLDRVYPIDSDLQHVDGQPPKEAASSNLYDRIHRIEREMLQGVDTRFLVEEAERMSRVLNEVHSSQGQASSTQAQGDAAQDDAPTQLMSKQPFRHA